MTLEEIFDQLTYGELSQLFIGGAETQGITVDNRRQVLNHINLGLTELHKRFLLREGRVVITRDPSLQSYPLDRRYAKSNLMGMEPIQFIEDSESVPFENDVLRIERVYDDKGQELSLNDEGDPDGVLTTSMGTLWVPAHLETPRLRVDYRANHPIIDRDQGAFDPESVEVALPYSHLEPLLLFVASRVHNPFGAGGVEGGMHEGNNYAAKFEQACKRLENLNYRLDRTHQTTKFEARGFV